MNIQPFSISFSCTSQYRRTDLVQILLLSLYNNFKTWLSITHKCFCIFTFSLIIKVFLTKVKLMCFSKTHCLKAALQNILKVNVNNVLYLQDFFEGIFTFSRLELGSNILYILLWYKQPSSWDLLYTHTVYPTSYKELSDITLYILWRYKGWDLDLEGIELKNHILSIMKPNNVDFNCMENKTLRHFSKYLLFVP